MLGQPPIRSASFINDMDLMRSTPRQRFAAEQSKKMMGSNVLTGKDNRASASVQCPKCGRWHRPGTVCPRLAKTMDVEVLLNPGVIEKGVVKTKPKSGNPYHDSRTGRFASQGGGSGAGPKAASSGWTVHPEGGYSAMGGRARIRQEGKKWLLELDGETHELPKKASFTHAESIIQQKASERVEQLKGHLDKLKGHIERMEGASARVEAAREKTKAAREKVKAAREKLDQRAEQAATPAAPSSAPQQTPGGGRTFEQGSPAHQAYTGTRAQGGTVGEGLTAANAVEKKGTPAEGDIFVGQQQFAAGTPGHETYQQEQAKGASSGWAAKEAKAADQTAAQASTDTPKPTAGSVDEDGGINIAHLLGGGESAQPAQPASPSPFHSEQPTELSGTAAKDQKMRDAYAQAMATGATPDQAEKWALSQGYPEHFPPPKGYQGPPPESMAPLMSPYLYLNAPGTTFSSGMSQGQAVGAGLATPGGTMPATVNLAQQGTKNLLNAPAKPKQPTPAEQQKQLSETSQQLKNQEQGYFQRLRNWLSQYVR